MASSVDICNRALQKLGAKRITSLSEASTNARSCNACYETIRDAELRKHPWNFAIKIVALAADSSAPAWGRANAFQLPADFIRLMNDYPEDNLNNKDWVVQGGKIYTDDSAPLYVRYISRIEDTTLFDALFIESLASKMAFEMAEELTQSNTKKEAARADYNEAIKDARRANAFDNVSAEPPEDNWITARS
jgi:hypothetical protein